MKKLIIVVLLMVADIFIMKAQEKIHWMDIKEALVLVQKEPRKLMVDVYTDWCGWCKVMDRTTFSDSNIINYVNENFYPVKFNAEQKEDITIGDKTFKYVAREGRGYHELAAVLLNGKLGYPSTVFIDEKSTIVQIISGYKKPEEFDVVLNFFGSNNYLTKTFDEFRKTYKSKVVKEN